MQQATVTPALYFDPRGCAKGAISVRYSIYFGGKQRLVATGVILDEKDVKFIQCYKKIYARNLSKGKKAPKIEDAAQKFIWDILYGDSYVDPEIGKVCVGYLRKAYDVIAYLGDAFDFTLFKKYVLDFDSFSRAGLSKTGPNQVLAELAQSEATEEVMLPSFPDDVLMALMAEYKFMYKEERYGTGDSFKDSAMSLFRFYLNYRHENKAMFGNNHDYSIKFKMLTPSFLNSYERWMYRFGKKAHKRNAPPTAASPSTVGIYTQNLRKVFNGAINAGMVSAKSYPFAKGKYVIPASRNIKKARTLEEIEQIIEFPCENESDLLGRDMWLFSYMANGANMADILRIRWRDLGSGRFSFIRRKTINTKKKDLTPIDVYINDLAQEIINRWGHKTKNRNDYVFPFQSTQMTTLQAHKATKLFTGRVNDAMARVAKTLGIRGRVTTYAARHSFATIMLQSGASFVMISKLLGHSNTTTTQSYYDDFEDNQVKLAVQALIPKKVPVHKIDAQFRNEHQLAKQHRSV